MLRATLEGSPVGKDLYFATKYVSEEKSYGPYYHYRDSGFGNPVEPPPLTYNKNATIVKGNAEPDNSKV